MDDKELKRNQTGVNSKQHSKSKEKLTEKEIKELMKHSSYERRGGSIRQVRQG
mgnify:CR=1 FL=1